MNNVSQSFDLALDVDAMAKRAEELQLRISELRGLRLRERRQERDPDYVERVAALDMLKEVHA